MINFLQSNGIKLRAPKRSDKGYRYPKVAPIYPLPEGMTYNSETDWVDGSCYPTVYDPPTDTVVNITQQGSRSANTTALQNAIDAAALRTTGTTIIVEAGIEVTHFTLRTRVSGWTGRIYIISSMQDNLPVSVSPYQEPLSARVIPSRDKQYMWKVVGTVSTLVVIRGEPEASGYWLSGMELYEAPGIWTTTLISYSPPVQSDVTVDGRIATDVVFDRVYVHGNDDGTVQGRGIYAMFHRGAIINSHISRIKGDGVETQAVLIISTEGKIKVDNSYVEATTENSMAGGGGGYPGWTPSDIQITGNHYRKRIEWNEGGKNYNGRNNSIKNLIEFKMGKRVLIQGNVFENSWPDGQNIVMNLKATSQSGATPWITTQDITVRYNTFINYWALFSLSGTPEGFTVADDGGYYDIHNNLCIQAHNLNALDAVTDKLNTYTFATGADVHTFRLKNNTFIHNTAKYLALFNGGAPCDPLIIEDNIFVIGSSGGMINGGGNTFNGARPAINDGNANLQYFHPGSSFQNNILVVNGRSMSSARKDEYSSGTVVDAKLDDVFHSWRNLNPRIKMDSLRFAGTNGTTPGCNVDKVLEIYNSVRRDAYDD